jgi:tetratricopeptide (TPR) repeat protein
MTTGPLRLTAAMLLTAGLAAPAIARAQQSTPTTDAPVTKDSTDIRALQREFRRLLDANQMAEALPIAKRLVELSEGYSLAMRIGARFDLAALRRELDDLDGAVQEYNVVIAMAKDAGDVGAYLGMVYDNVAMIKRAQDQWEAAESASDRALEIFEKTLGAHDMHYGAALNNRAIILSDQGKSVLALDYSERALAVLRESFAGNPKALEPFLEDNRRIRAELPRE